MNKLFLLLGTILLVAATSMAQATAPKTVPKPSTKTEKQHKQPKVVPTDDAGIQQCIEGRLAKTKMANEGFQVAVSSATATFSGTTKNAGYKGGVSGLSKVCGAKKVVNNIALEKSAKTPKPINAPKPKN